MTSGKCGYDHPRSRHGPRAGRGRLSGRHCRGGHHFVSCLVTGGAGFLGSHLCERLLNDGREVICVDNCFTGNKENIYHLINHPRFEFMRHDVTFSLYVEVDEIYNLACPASPIHYQFDPVPTAPGCTCTTAGW
ncbi:MAG: GDP-mannose 4,6-dehydratase [Desulfobacterales bacterium]